MNQLATVREISDEPELRIVPLERARAAWENLAGSHPEATLYHRGPWLEVLRRAFGVHPSVAIIGESESTLAACLLAPGGNPIRRSLISLPFSDFCPPLAVDDSARDSLMPWLSNLTASRLEIRGVAASNPWHVLDHFQRWTLDLSRPSRRSSALPTAKCDAICVAPPRQGSRLNVRAASTQSKTSLASSSKAGAASESRRNRTSFSGLVHEVFAKLDSIEVWFASHQGKRIAAVVVLRDGDVLHAKWSARAAGGPDGASHSIFMSIVEHHACTLAHSTSAALTAATAGSRDSSANSAPPHPRCRTATFRKCPT